MKLVRWYLGGCLIVIGRVAIWAGQTLFRIGTAVMPHDAANVSQCVSTARRGLLVPYTVLTRDGRHITLYSLERR